MDDELRSVLAKMHSDTMNAIAGAEEKHRTELQKIADDFNVAHQATTKTLAVHTGHIQRLWRRINGSDPPPAPPSAVLSPTANAKSPEPEDKDPALGVVVDGHEAQLSEHDLEIAGLHGQFLALDSKIGAVVKTVEKLLGDTAKQSTAMGLTNDKKPESIRAEHRLRNWTSLIAAITGLISVLAGTYAAATGRFPGQGPVLAPNPPAHHVEWMGPQ